MILGHKQTRLVLGCEFSKRDASNRHVSVRILQLHMSIVSNRFLLFFGEREKRTLSILDSVEGLCISKGEFVKLYAEGMMVENAVQTLIGGEVGVFDSLQDSLHPEVLASPGVDCSFV